MIDFDIFLSTKGDSDEFECNFGKTMQKNIKKTTENLKMKIVPDITVNAALNGQSFDATLPQEANQWLVSLRQTYITCKLVCHFNFETCIVLISQYFHEFS